VPSERSTALARDARPCWGDGVNGPRECIEGGQPCELHFKVATLIDEAEARGRVEQKEAPVNCSRNSASIRSLLPSERGVKRPRKEHRSELPIRGAPRMAR
jgi:hypothetical protein